MSDLRHIAVVTGSRADYGLLSGLMLALNERPKVSLQVIVTGMHLHERFGLTIDEIRDDGMAITATVPILEDGDSELNVINSVGRGIVGLAETFVKLATDLVVVLGDRTETLAAAQAAMLLRIPLAHIHGGESTEGAVDDLIRHAVTKMAHHHFVAAEPYRRRVVQMGENPAHVHLVGAPGLDDIQLLSFKSVGELEAEFNFNLSSGPILLLTYHPVTLDPKASVGGIRALLKALKRFEGYRLVFTGVNSDAGREVITKLIGDFAADHDVLVRGSLGRVNYLSMLQAAVVLVGNSSSGIIEAPALGIPTVNIGSRQDGRLRAASIKDCKEDPDDIEAAIRYVLRPEFKTTWPDPLSLYGRGDTANQIADILTNVELKFRKQFYEW